MPDLEADLFQLAMSKEAEPLMDAVKKHIALRYGAGVFLRQDE